MVSEGVGGTEWEREALEDEDEDEDEDMRFTDVLCRQHVDRTV